MSLGPDLRVPKDLPTAWKRSDGKGYYNFGALAFYLANLELKAADYLKKCQGENYQLLAFGDRKAINDYFT